LGKSYVANPVTVGEQLRNRRLELRLVQKEVAKIIGVSDETINNWEHNHTEPPVSASDKILGFLGYSPFKVDTSTLAGKLKAYRYSNGLSQEQAGKTLDLDETTINKIELGKVKLSNKTLEKLRPVTGN
jgi:transcriptional regulator with XRE-family HTH domain